MRCILLLAPLLVDACALPPPPPKASAPPEPTEASAPDETDDVTAPPPPDDTPTLHPVEYHGQLDSAEVGALIESHAREFRACKLHGTALVQVVVDPRGRARPRYVKESLTGDDKDCPLAVLRSLDFPHPAETAEALVPLVFRAARTNGGP